jgi:hypothetical protein
MVWLGSIGPYDQRLLSEASVTTWFNVTDTGSPMQLDISLRFRIASQGITRTDTCTVFAMTLAIQPFTSTLRCVRSLRVLVSFFITDVFSTSQRQLAFRYATLAGHVDWAAVWRHRRPGSADDEPITYVHLYSLSLCFVI